MPRSVTWGQQLQQASFRLNVREARDTLHSCCSSCSGGRLHVTCAFAVVGDEVGGGEGGGEETHIIQGQQQGRRRALPQTL